eukprot:GHRQ01024066.1.p2 GENE.GHRQ01024066.1~~GHRQ01024066.1.p2  ORF type:complete len:102 (-),score=10.32 GHRQ01024066.1:456-761(-)
MYMTSVHHKDKLPFSPLASHKKPSIGEAAVAASRQLPPVACKASVLHCHLSCELPAATLQAFTGQQLQNMSMRNWRRCCSREPAMYMIQMTQHLKCHGCEL